MPSPFEVHGLAGVLDALKALPPELSSKNGGIVRAALFKGGKIIRDEARRRAPRRTGKLAKEGIVLKRDKDPRRHGANERYEVGFSKPGFYGAFEEFGTSHQPARPFLRPAFEGKKQDAFNAIVEALKTGVQRAARKVARGEK